MNKFYYEDVNYRESEPAKSKKPFLIGGGFLAAILLSACILLPMFIEKIPTGYVGLVYSPSGGVEDDTLQAGWHIIGLFDKVIEYPIKLQTKQYDSMQLATRDGKSIPLDISYSYKVDPASAVSIFKEFGNISIDDVENGYLEKRMFDAARETVSNYDLLAIYGSDASKASLEIQDKFSKDVKKLGFMVSDVAMGSPKPDAATKQAIDARILASQETEKKKIELQNEKIEAEKKKVIAQGNADKEIIEAKAKAEANEIIQKSITPEVLQHMEAQARNKHGWIEVQGGTPIVDTK